MVGILFVVIQTKIQNWLRNNKIINGKYLCKFAKHEQIQRFHFDVFSVISFGEISINLGGNESKMRLHIMLKPYCCFKDVNYR